LRNESDFESISGTFKHAILKTPAPIEFDIGVVSQCPAVIAASPGTAILVIDASGGAAVIVEVAITVVPRHVAGQGA